MRWLFLLLIVLNAFYYLWHQQQAPVRLARLAPVEGYRHAGRRIDLMNESKRQLVPVEQKELSVTPLQGVCLFLGSFNDRLAADTLMQQLLSRDVAASVQETEVAAGTDYWVYLSPLASRQAAIRQLRELQSRNIDSYVVTVGELKNAISLGIFSREAAAQELMRRVTGLGYSPLLKRLPRTHKRYAVRVELDAGGLSDELLQRVGAGTLEHFERSCEPVAVKDELE